ncbi:unnamed protein product [Polarella glacialis]|uniref:Uncharacterized protein n=1 Tax=Polarella glacialis TaxID=89957 RepID=A0A813K2W9_POLGL|nr:unnamed protein product [Polarella glacialis]CAE8690086.1 unnamed protein product [Polarella glacialis]
MAGIAAALSIGPEADACRRFCAEVLGAARHWGPSEQRVLFERLPLLLQRLYVWFGLSNQGLEEALLRTFHPTGPLSAHLAVLESPAFVFPLRRLPPRALRAAVLSISDHDRSLGLPEGARAYNRGRDNDDLGSSWFALLGPSRLARSPAGDVEGLSLTAQEFVLTCLVHFLVAETLFAPAVGQAASGGGSAGAFASGGSSGSGSGGTGFGGGMSLPGAGGSWGSGGGGRTSRTPGALSPCFERLLLAHLQAHLPHSQYELAYAHEPRAARFLMRLLHEFLVAPQPLTEALPASLRRDSGAPALDVRAQPAALHAARLVTLHMLANPALRQGCEESFGSNGLSASRGRVARITREVTLLGPPSGQMVAELLVCLASQKQVGLETLTSLMRLWLVLLQPWKARRLYEWYLSVRPAEPRLEPPSSQSSGLPQAIKKTTRPVDVALLGLEPEMPGAAEAPAPLVPQALAAAVEAQAGTNGTGATLAAAVGLTSGLSVAAATASSAPLVPGDGDALSWRSYVMKFQFAYGLLEGFLTTPLHMKLTLELCRYGAGWSTNTAGSAMFTGSDQPPAAWGSAPSPTALQLLRQRNAIQALKALAQALLCFSDPELLQVLRSDSLPDRGGVPDKSSAEAKALPLFDDSGVLRPQLVMATSVTWAALLAAASVAELQPLLAAVSRQLQHSPAWVQHRLPALEDAERHRPFAQQVLQEIGQRPPPAATPGRPPVSGTATAEPSSAPYTFGWSVTPLSEAQFVGSEWQRPLRGGEVELLLQVTYWVADLTDRMLGREPRLTTCGQVPQTEWPRMFANWKFLMLVFLLLQFAVFW